MVHERLVNIRLEVHSQLGTRSYLTVVFLDSDWEVRQGIELNTFKASL